MRDVLFSSSCCSLLNDTENDDLAPSDRDFRMTYPSSILLKLTGSLQVVKWIPAFNVDTAFIGLGNVELLKQKDD